MDWYALFNIGLVFLFGALFGFAEILQRYSNMKYNFKVMMSYLYIGLNGIVAILALFLIKYIKNPNDNVVDFHNNIEIVNLLIAGFSGMMVLRSSIFSIKHKEKTIEVGLATLFQVFLDRVEKRMKNKAAALRLERIEKIMKDIDYISAVQGLPLLCTEFIDNFPSEDITELFTAIDKITNTSIGDSEKSLLLGRQIAKYCDEDILEKSVARYKKSTVEEEISSRQRILMNKN